MGRVSGIWPFCGIGALFFLVVCDENSRWHIFTLAGIALGTFGCFFVAKKNVVDSQSVVDSKKIFFSGLLLHLTNPKAIFVWLSIVTFAMQSGGHSQTAFAVVLGCGLIGMGVFFTYALLFSTAIAQRIYSKMRIVFEGLLAVFFGYAAFRMFTSTVKEV